jgi:hypothetical protein
MWRKTFHTCENFVFLQYAIITGDLGRGEISLSPLPGFPGLPIPDKGIIKYHHIKSGQKVIIRVQLFTIFVVQIFCWKFMSIVAVA